METLIREGNGEIVNRIIGEFCKRIQEVILSPNAHADQRLAILCLIDALAVLRRSSTLQDANSATDLPKFLHLLHMELSSRRSEPEVTEEAAKILARLVTSSSLLATSAELIETELSAATRSLCENDQNCFASVCVSLRIIQLLLSSSALTPHYSGFLEGIWNAISSPRPLPVLRERAAELLSIFLGVKSEAVNTGNSIHLTPSPPPLPIQLQFRQRALQQISLLLSANSSSIGSLHGAILIANILQAKSEDPLSEEVIESFFKLTNHKEPLIRSAAIKLFPCLLRSIDSGLLGRWIHSLLEMISGKKERIPALKALSATVLNQSPSNIEPFMDAIVPSLKTIFLQHRNSRNRDLSDLNAALDCVAQLSVSLKSAFKRALLLHLLPSLLAPNPSSSSTLSSTSSATSSTSPHSLLWPEFIDALARITSALPEAIVFCEDVLLAECKSVLLAAPETVEIDRLVVAIKCLSRFPFTECILAGPIGARLMQVFLNDPRSPLIRAEAAECLMYKCRELKLEKGVPRGRHIADGIDSGDKDFINEITAQNNSNSPYNSPFFKFNSSNCFKIRAPYPGANAMACCPLTKWMVRGVVAAIATRMVADEDPFVGARIMNILGGADDECFAAILAHPDCIRPLVTFMASNNAPLGQRVQAARILGQVATINPATLLPSFRRLLLQYLSEIECLPVAGETESLNEEATPADDACPRFCSARLLQVILDWPSSLVIPYVQALQRALLPRLRNPSVELIECFLGSLGRLVQISPEEFGNQTVLTGLLRVLLDLIADQGSLRKRRAGLEALSKLLTFINRSQLGGAEVAREILGGILGVLRGEADSGVRREALRVVGILGAIDPYLESIGSASGSVVGSDNKSVMGNPSEIANSTARLPSEEYFAGVAVEALLKLLKDSSLSVHHVSATQALVYLFKTLGSRAQVFLPSVMPVMLSLLNGQNGIITTSNTTSTTATTTTTNTNSPSASSNEFFYHQLAGMIAVVGVYIRPWIDGDGLLISLMVAELSSGSSLALLEATKTAAILHLIDVCAQALKGEFRTQIPRLLPLLLQLLQVRPFTSATSNLTNTVAMLSLQKALQTLAILGPHLGDYAGVIGDTLVGLLRSGARGRANHPLELRCMTLRVTTSICTNVAAVADNPAVLQSLAAILRDDSEPSAVHALCMDGVMVLALAQGHDFFRFLPALAPLIARRQGPRHMAFFDRLMAAKESLNSPAKIAELTAECFRVIEGQLSDLTVSGVGSGVSVVNSGMQSNHHHHQSHQSSNTTTNFSTLAWKLPDGPGREEWLEWLRRLGLELLRESPSPSLRACASLASVYHPLGRELFNPAFASVFPELSGEGQSLVIQSLQAALMSPIIPGEVVQAVLNVAEFMERAERPLPIDFQVLGTHAARYHAFAKALYYKEQELLGEAGLDGGQEKEGTSK